MSKIFDALKKAKNDQTDALFRPSGNTERVARAPKYHPTQPNPDENKPELRTSSLKLASAIQPGNGAPLDTTANSAELEERAQYSPVIEDTSQSTKPLTRPVPPPIIETIKHQRMVLPNRPNLVAIGDRSLAGEQFAGLRAKLMVMRREQNIQTICVTSSVMGEGKTFVSSNISLTLAGESERGGILIDCDLRNPSVHRAFGIRDALGMADYLQSDNVSLDSVIIDTDHRLSIIPCGRIPKNPLALLDSAKLKELIAHLRERYDFVIIDAPPTAPLPDADLLASLADGLLFVVRANQTPLGIIQRSLKMLSKRTILGTVLNGTDEMPSYSYYYTYGQRPEGKK